MDFKEFTATEDDNDRRLDRIIRKIVPKENLSDLYKAIRKGLIKVNGKKSENNAHILKGDIIKIPSFFFTESSINTHLNTQQNDKTPFKKNDEDLQIIFINKDLLVINKPYDIAVHGTSNSLEKKVVDFYKKNFPDKTSLSFLPGPLHRLDRKTTGLLAFSMSLNGARWFSENIANHSIKKIYISILQGKILQKQKWSDYIAKEYSTEKTFQTVFVSSVKKDTFNLAITTISPIKYFDYKNIPCTLAEIEIETGRTHQIRSQAAFHGFPLLGDTAYGGKKINEEENFFLHAKTLLFPNERLEGFPLKLEAELPSSFKKILIKNNATP